MTEYEKAYATSPSPLWTRRFHSTILKELKTYHKEGEVRVNTTAPYE